METNRLTALDEFERRPVYGGLWGTDAAVIVENLSEVSNLLGRTIYALQRAAPNHRDWVHSNRGWALTVEKYQARVDVLESVLRDIHADMDEAETQTCR